MKKISAELIQGELTEIVGHVIESDNNLGRSVVVDVTQPSSNNIRQVDHRTIEYIILKNVKYSLGKKWAGPEELPLKHPKDAIKWHGSKLAVGNWFSSVQYFKVNTIVDKDNVKVCSPANPSLELTMSRDILEYEMHSAKLYDTEEKLPRTKIVELMTGARDNVLTVKFHTKVKAENVKDILADIKKD